MVRQRLYDLILCFAVVSQVLEKSRAIEVVFSSRSPQISRFSPNFLPYEESDFALPICRLEILENAPEKLQFEDFGRCGEADSKM